MKAAGGVSFDPAVALIEADQSSSATGKPGAPGALGALGADAQFEALLRALRQERQQRLRQLGEDLNRSQGPPDAPAQLPATLKASLLEPPRVSAQAVELKEEEGCLPTTYHEEPIGELTEQEDGLPCGHKKYKVVDMFREGSEELADENHHNKRSSLNTVSSAQSAKSNNVVEALRVAVQANMSTSSRQLSRVRSFRTALVEPARAGESRCRFCWSAVGLALTVFPSMVVCIHMVVIGVEVQYEAANHGPQPTIFETLSVAFGLYYLLELLIRIAWAPREFCSKKQRFMNALDCVLVVISIMEVSLMASPSFDASNLRILRLLRTARVARILKIVISCTAFLDFYKMVFAILGAAGTLGWALGVLSIMIYIFSVILTQGSHDTIVQCDLKMEVCSGLKKDFGSLFLSCYTLFKVISSGENWGEIFDRLLTTGVAMPIVFLIFVALAILGVLNIVTSIFIDSVMHTSEHFRELAVMEAKSSRNRNLERLTRLFKEIDSDGNGTLTFEELRCCFMDEEIELWFEALGVTQADAEVLFTVIDYDDSGAVDADEFFTAFSKLQGAARSFDVNVLILAAQEVLKRFEDVEVRILGVAGDVKSVKKQMKKGLPDGGKAGKVGHGRT